MNEIDSKRLRGLLGLICLCSTLAARPAAAGLVDPIPPGYRLHAMFTGADNASAGSVSRLATAVICSNYDVKDSVTVRVEFGAYPATASISPGATRIFSTRALSFHYGEIVADVPTITGVTSGRILVSGGRKIICGGQLLRDATIPDYIVPLPMFGRDGKPR